MYWQGQQQHLLFKILFPIFVQRLRSKPWTYKSKFCFSFMLFIHVVIPYPIFEASDWSEFGDLARRRETSHGVASLLLMVPLEPWRNSTPFFGAAAFCTTKIGDFRTSSALSSLTTWLRRPLRRDHPGGTNCRYSPFI